MYKKAILIDRRNEGAFHSLSSFHDETLKAVVVSLRVQVELLAFLAEAEQRLFGLIANFHRRVDRADEHQLVEIFTTVQQGHRHTGGLPKLSTVVLQSVQKLRQYLKMDERWSVD